MLKDQIIEPEKLLDALKKLYPDSSNQTLRSMIKNKRVCVDGQISLRADFLIEPDARISIASSTKKVPHGIQMIYDDKVLIAINKPDGLLSVPLDEGNCISALNILREYFHTKEIFAVHRIDKETSGVMIFARGKTAVPKLKEMFLNHDFKRVYIAAVHGNLKEDKGTWKNRLMEQENYDVTSTQNESEGKLAITHFSVIKRSKNHTFLKLILETGRKHQIRVHCKEAGHPIVGDNRYGPPEVSKIRMCLHAHILEFIHPITDKKMRFSAPIPTEFIHLGYREK